MFLSLFCILSISAPVNITNFITGNWNISALTITPEGVEDEESRVRYEVIFQKSEEDQYEFLGEIMGENEEGILSPVLRMKLELSDDDPNEIKISIGSPEGEDYDELTKVVANTDEVENAITIAGKIGDDVYSFVTLSDFEAEITHHNHETKTNTLYRLEKDRPPAQNSPSLMNFMPMIMMFIMQCMNQPRPPPAQGQNAQGGGDGGAQSQE